jgi:hypothetical protein
VSSPIALALSQRFSSAFLRVEARIESFSVLKHGTRDVKQAATNCAKSASMLQPRIISRPKRLLLEASSLLA